MAHSINDIDGVFRSRFDGLKDHSQSPVVGWAEVEAQLDAGAGHTPMAIHTEGSVWAKPVAVVCGALLLAGISADQRPTAFEHHSEEAQNVSAPTESAINSEAATLSFEPSTLSNSPVLAVNTEVSSSPDVQPSDVAVFEPSSSDFEPLAQNSERPLDAITLMDRGQLAPSEATLPQREAPEMEKTRKRPFMVYARVALRTGAGESNSYEVEARQSTNALLAVGGGVALSSLSFVTAEAGWVRKSGSGIERARLLSGSAPDVVAYEVLVATRMDYLHIPVMYHHVLAGLPVFSRCWNVSVGGYTDVLLAAKNEGYTMLNGIYTPSTSSEKSLNGLTRARVGFAAGLERHIWKNWVVNATLVFPSINGGVDEKSGFRGFDDANKAIDLHLGIKFVL